MEVVATRDGHFGGLYRRVGAKFDAPDDAKSSWFVPSNSKEAKSVKDTGKTGGSAGVATKFKSVGEIDVI